jgi:acyl dehydratase
MRPTPLTIERFQALAGSVVGESRWFLLDQDRIDRFADVTEDDQFIHTNPHRAAATPFGGTIAHGYLSLSLLSAMVFDCIPAVEGETMGMNYGFDKIRFLSPVRSGKRVRGRFTLASVGAKAGGWLFTWAVEVEIEGETKPALVADWLTLSVAG